MKDQTAEKEIDVRGILFIGGGGFIGSNIISMLSGTKESTLHVLEPEFASLSRIDGKQVVVHRGVLADTDLLEKIIVQNGINIVVHLVSTIIPGSTYEDYEREFTRVIFPSIRLMELCCKRNVRFVYFSSGGTVYGEQHTENNHFKESDMMAPISYYGWSKQMMENSILFMHRTQNLQYLIFRPSNPYGYGQNLYGKQGLIAVALGNILAGHSLKVWGDGGVIRDYIFIEDLAKAVADVLRDKSIINMTINIGSGIGYSINEVVNIIKEIVDEDVVVEYVSPRKADVSAVVLDTQRIRQLIDFRPIEIKEGIRKFYKAVKNG